MKKLWKKWHEITLVTRIALGLVIGVVLGVVFPVASWLTILGNLFVGALKGIAPLLVFVLVIASVANASNAVGHKMGKVLALYIISTVLAASCAVVASFIFPVSIRLTGVEAAANAAPGTLGEVVNNLLVNLVENPVSAIANANYIGVLCWAIVIGLALKGLAADGTKSAIGELSDAVTQVVRWVIQFAPVGILGLVYTSVSTNGLSIFLDYGKLLALLVGTLLFQALIVSPIMASLYIGRNAYPLLWICIKESSVTAFFTRSSAANIPVNMALCEKLGLDKDLYSVSIPLGATINMNGAAITITIMTLAAANTLGIQVSLSAAILLSLLATVAACGSSGVAGGSLLLIPLACSMFGIPNEIAMQVVGVGFIIGVIQDSFETALNSAGDVLFASSAEFREWVKQGKPLPF